MDQSPDPQEKNDLPTIKMYQDIVDRSRKEVDHVRDVYKWLSGLIAIIFAAGIFVSYKSLSDMKAYMKEEVEIMKDRAAHKYSMLESKLTSSVEDKVQNVENKVDSRIDAEFNKDNIQGMVREKAQERIDKVADEIIAKQIEKKVAPKIAIVDKKLNDMNASMEFNTLLDVADDDRVAFDKLRKLANDKFFPHRAMAEQRIKSIVAHSKVEVWRASSPPFPWKTGVDPKQLNISDLRKEYNPTSPTIEKVVLMEFVVYQREDIPKKDKLDFIVDVIKSENSLSALQNIIHMFNQLTNQEFHPVLDIQAIPVWYEKNKQNIK